MGRGSKMDRGMTVNQRRFVEEYMKCGNATEAFRAANPRTSTWKETSIVQVASTTFNSPVVFKEISRLKELENASVIARSSVTKVDVINKLKELSDKAESEGVYGVSVRCQELLGKSLGMFVDKVEQGPQTIVLNSNIPDRDGKLVRELKKLESS